MPIYWFQFVSSKDWNHLFLSNFESSKLLFTQDHKGSNTRRAQKILKSESCFGTKGRRECLFSGSRMSIRDGIGK